MPIYNRTLTTRLNSRDAYFAALFWRYRRQTMVPFGQFVDNLRLLHIWCNSNASKKGAIVECGTWRGGMAAAMMHVAGPSRPYMFFDSFKGLPDVTVEDGPRAAEWKRNTTSPRYFNNCTASREEFNATISMASQSKDIQVIPGWFVDTLPEYRGVPIAVLRLDADWYASTRLCLTHLWPHVVEGGLIIIDDYYIWPGCRRAVHEYLSKEKEDGAIEQTSASGVAFVIKAQHAQQ